MQRLTVLARGSVSIGQKLFQPKLKSASVRCISTTKFCMNEKKTPSETEAPFEPETVIETSSEISGHEIRIKELEDEIKDSKDKLLRSYAEEENVRRIARKDVNDARAYAVSSFAKSLLDVADNLDRALAATPADKMTGEHAENTLKALVEGVQLTNKELEKVFNKFGVTKFGEVGDIFDPNKHDALYNIPITGQEETPPVEGSIGQVVKVGYQLKDRVLRAAEVGAYMKK